MQITTLFESVTARIFGPVAVVRTRDLKALIRRLHAAEVGFDYAVRREIPRIQQSRDQHMLNAQKLRDQLAAQGIAARSDETPQEVRPEGQEPGPQDAPEPSREPSTQPTPTQEPAK